MKSRIFTKIWRFKNFGKFSGKLTFRDFDRTAKLSRKLVLREVDLTATYDRITRIATPDLGVPEF
jgi:hypothetical protein